MTFTIDSGFDWIVFGPVVFPMFGFSKLESGMFSCYCFHFYFSTLCSVGGWGYIRYNSLTEKTTTTKYKKFQPFFGLLK